MIDGKIASYHLADLKAIQARHHNVKNDEIRLLLLCFFYTIKAVAGSDDRKIHGLKITLQKVECISFIIDNKYPVAFFHALPFLAPKYSIQRK